MRLIAVRLSLTVVAALLAWVGTAAQSASTPPEIASVLTEAAHFTSDDLALLESGQVIARTETFPDLLEASVVAAVRINSQKDRTLAYFKTLISYVDGQVTTGYGTFGRPPIDADVTSLTLDRGDIVDLESCVPGDCAIRLRAAAPDATPPAIDWTATDAASKANVWMRQQLAAYTADYAQRGNAALVAFDDQAKPVNLIGHWQALADRSTLIARLAPALLRYATTYPLSADPGVTDELYWDHQHYLGLKPIIGVTHLVSYTDPSRPQRSVLLQKQVYASHYLYGSLALTLLLQTTPQAPVTYVVYVNRARGDLLRAGQAQQPTSTQTTNRGGLSGALSGIRAGLNNLGGTLQRRLGEQMIRSSAERLLSSMKEALER